MSVKVTVLDANQALSAHQVEQGGVLVLQAQNNVNYQLTDQATGFGPQNIITKRQGDDLVIMLDDGNLEPDIVIENYYDQEGAQIIGLHENGNLYAYVPQSGEVSQSISLLAEEVMASQALGGTELAVPFWAFNPWWLSGAGAVLALAGVVAAAGGGSKNSGGQDNTPPSAPKVESVQHTGTNSSFVKGTAEPNTTVYIRDAQGVVIGEGKTDANGNFEITTTRAVTTDDKLVVTAKDGAGRESSEFELNTNTATNESNVVPSVSNTKNNIENGAIVSTTLTVKASPNTLVEVRDTQGNVIGRGYTDASGNVEITTTTPLMAQPYNVVALSPLGKESQPAEVTGDTTAPSRPTATLENNFEERTGEDGNTVKTIVSANVVGKADPKATVKLLDANGNPVKDENNNDITTMADEDGTYSFKNLPALPHGQNYTVIAEDASGLPSPNAKAVSDHLEPKSPIVTGVVNGVNDAGQPITTISGVGEKEGDLIDILGNDGNLITTVKVNRDLSFSAVVPPMKTGDNFSVIEKDSAQNVSKPASAKGNTEQVEAPSLNLIENEHGGLTAEGYAAPGATVSVVFPNGETRTVKADETGFYSIVDFVPQKAGDTAKVSASQVNVFGNSSPSTEKTYAKDQRAPEVELNETTYGKNEDAQPTQTISGKTEIGATVLLKGSDGSEVPATVNEKGEFEATLPAKDKDGNPITYVVEASDINSSKAEEKVVADNETDAPQFTVSQAEDGKLVVSQKAGTAVEPNAMVEVTFPDGTTQTVQANEEGKFEPVQSEKAQKAGANQTVSAKATDDKGNSSSMPDAVTVEVAEPKVVAQKAVLDDSNAPESNELTIEAQPEIPFIVTDAQGNEIGRGQTGKDGKQVITTTRPLQEGEEIKVIALDPQDPTNEEKQKTTTLKTDTNAPSEPSIEFVQNDDGTVTARVGNNLQANEPGSTIEVTFPDGTKGSAVVKADGTFDPITSAQPQPNGDAKATQIDEANNSSEPVTENYQDKKEPVAPSVNSEATLPNGNSEIRGTAEPNSTVTLKDKDGKVLGQAKADDKGNFVIESNEPLMDGADYQVTATDANGNESPKADVTADTKVNEPSVEITENPDGTLTVSPKLGTDGTPLKDENGQPLNEPGSTIDVTFPDGTIGKAVVNPDGSFAPIVSEKPQTSGELSVTATDNKGNTSNATEEYTDEKEPTAPQISENKNNQNEFGEPESTTVTGTAEPNSVVSIIDPATGEVLGEGKADKDGNFIITTNKALEDKPYDVKATDEAGNSSTPTEVKGDTDVPNKPSISFKQDENGIITATVGDNPQANEPGSIIEVTFPDGSKGSAVVKADGTFDPIMSEQPQIRGGEASAVAKDEQGNSSDPDVAIFEDKIKPALPHVDSVKNNHHDHTTTLSGNAEPGALVELKDEKGNLIGAVQADDKGDFTLVVPTLEHGAPFTLTAKDENNNTSDAIPVVGDTVAPKSPAPTVESIVAGQDENGKPITVLKGKVEGAEKGTKVTVTDPNTNEVLGTAETDENGEFTLETIKPLDNSLNYPLTAIDSYNNASQPTPVTTDLDKDGVTNEEEAQAKADIEKALETAKKAEEEYKKALEDAGNAIDQGEKEKLDGLAKVAEEAKKAVQDLIDNLPKTTGNTEADQAYAKEQQDKLDELNSDVPVANDADGDDISDETEANAKQAVEKAVEKAQKAKETYDQALKDAGNAISDEEKAELDKLAKAVEDAKKEAQDLIDALPTSIGDKAGDQAFAEEQKTALGAVETPVVPAANDADKDDLTDAEEKAKVDAFINEDKANTDGANLDAVKAAKKAYDDELAKATGTGDAPNNQPTITPKEAEDLAKAKEALDAAIAKAQEKLNGLKAELGNTDEDGNKVAELQRLLDAQKVENVPAANDADNDGMTDAEEKAKVDAFINEDKANTDGANLDAVKAAKKAYDDELAKATGTGDAPNNQPTITPKEAEDLAKAKEALDAAIAKAQEKLNGLKAELGNTDEDGNKVAELQRLLDAQKVENVPAANDADNDGMTDAEEKAKVDAFINEDKANTDGANLDAVKAAKKAYDDELAKATGTGDAPNNQPTITPKEAEDLAKAKEALDAAIAKAQEKLNGLKAELGNTDEDGNKVAELQRLLDAQKVENVPAANDADNDGMTDAEEKAKVDAFINEDKANTDGANLDAVKAAKKAYDDELAKATGTGDAPNNQPTITPKEAEDLAKAKEALDAAIAKAQEKLNGLKAELGNTDEDGNKVAELQRLLDAQKVENVPAANDADNDGMTDAEEKAKVDAFINEDKANTDGANLDAVKAAKKAYDDELAKATGTGDAPNNQPTITPKEAEDLAKAKEALDAAIAKAQEKLNGLKAELGNTDEDGNKVAELQRLLDAQKVENVPAANDADNDGMTDAEEKAKVDAFINEDKANTDGANLDAVKAAKKAYDDELAKATGTGDAPNNQPTITPKEAEDLAKAKEALDAAIAKAQEKLNGLKAELGNTDEDGNKVAELQRLLDAQKVENVPAANDADNDGMTDAEEKAKVDAFINEDKANTDGANLDAVKAAKKAYDDELAKATGTGDAPNNQPTITPKEAEDLAKAKEALDAAIAKAQEKLNGLKAELGNTDEDGNKVAELQRLLDAQKVENVPAANDADNDGMTDAEEKAKVDAFINEDKANTDGANLDAVKAAKKAYDDELAKATGTGDAPNNQPTITPKEAEDLAKAKEALDAAIAKAQEKLNGLKAELGNTDEDGNKVAELQRLLDAQKVENVPAANDADNDGMTDAEEKAKVDAFINEDKANTDGANLDAVKAAKKAYDDELAKATGTGDAPNNQPTITPKEAEDLAKAKEALDAAIAKAQEKLNGLKAELGNTDEDGNKVAELQRLLDAQKVENVPAANDADNDGMTDAEEKAKVDAFINEDKANTDGANLDAVKAAKKAYDDELAKATGTGDAPNNQPTITPKEAEDLAKAKEALDAAIAKAQEKLNGLKAELGNTDEDGNKVAELQRLLDAQKVENVPAANDSDNDGITNATENGENGYEKPKSAVEAVERARNDYQRALEEATGPNGTGTITPTEATHLAGLATTLNNAIDAANQAVTDMKNTVVSDNKPSDEDNRVIDAYNNRIGQKVTAPAANDADSDDISDNAENTAKSEIQQKVQEAQNALKAYNDYLNGTALSNTAPNKGEVINPTEAAELARLKGELEQKLQDAQNALNNDWPTQVGTTESDNTDKQQLTNALGGITVPQDRPANDVNDNGIADDQDYINANTAYTQALADVNAINEKIRALTAENADDATKALTPAEREALVNEANVAKAKLNTAKDALAKVPNSYANPTNADETYAKLNEKVSALAVLEVPQANSTAGVKPDAQLVQEAQTELASAKAKVDEINRKLAETPIINANNKPALDQEAQAAQTALNNAKTKIGELPASTLPTGSADKARLTTEANKLNVNPVVSNDDDNDNITNTAEQQAITALNNAKTKLDNAKRDYTTALTTAKGTDNVITEAEATDLKTNANAVAAAKRELDELYNRYDTTVGTTASDAQQKPQYNVSGDLEKYAIAPTVVQGQNTNSTKGGMTITAGSDNLKLVLEFDLESGHGGGKKTLNFARQTVNDRWNFEGATSSGLLSYKFDTATKKSSTSGVDMVSFSDDGQSIILAPNAIKDLSQLKAYGIDEDNIRSGDTLLSSELDYLPDHGAQIFHNSDPNLNQYVLRPAGTLWAGLADDTMPTLNTSHTVVIELTYTLASGQEKTVYLSKLGSTGRTDPIYSITKTGDNNWDITTAKRVAVDNPELSQSGNFLNINKSRLAAEPNIRAKMFTGANEREIPIVDSNNSETVLESTTRDNPHTFDPNGFNGVKFFKGRGVLDILGTQEDSLAGFKPFENLNSDMSGYTVFRHIDGETGRMDYLYVQNGITVI